MFEIGISKRSVGLLACTACLAALPGGAAAKTGSPPVDLTNADHCDFIGQQQGSLCLLPFPDDYYTVPDAGTATGLRINLKTEATPANVAGQRVDTAPYSLNDGFSPGQTIVVKVPGLDSVAAMQRTGAVPINHIGQYARPDQPIVVIDATTGERWPIWSEIDSNAHRPEPGGAPPSTRPSTSPPSTATSSPCATCGPPAARRSRPRTASSTTATSCAPRLR